MAAVVGIISRRGLSIDACCRDQCNKSKLVMYVLPITFTLKIAILHAIANICSAWFLGIGILTCFLFVNYLLSK